MAALRRNTFRKLERLVSRKSFETLVQEGQSVHHPPVRLTWQRQVLSTGFPAATAFSVPKRNFRRAVDRNRIKRLLREAFRKNKAELYTLLEERKQEVALLFVFTGRKLPDYRQVETQVMRCLQQLTGQLRSHDE
ncbi:MAG: ribonuclease P protein component [Bacteroidota bacterium]|jgi:ribonuclease P protein component|uniref:ribonuclease P protein component n=1 Tax=Candidatus Pollutiaquabacter sp. TaxID=3416354 RepID=UPI001A4CF3A0|nr:ribonuclease P protein component [Bacteroidota bacterium]MBL7949957.1 ribonuclease P protein component [Bacteroidia bacterium]HPD52683.1 ribonuclease P protein component [Bacteroidia bacterium]HRI41057.1 ribonuclease P protein component [Bacteroidia bacterium]HRS37704.1 ribonuclease P protein component [Bacteroidia bacterium]